jgi:hypothetical protein
MVAWHPRVGCQRRPGVRKELLKSSASILWFTLRLDIGSHTATLYSSIWGTNLHYYAFLIPDAVKVIFSKNSLKSNLVQAVHLNKD